MAEPWLDQELMDSAFRSEPSKLWLSILIWAIKHIFCYFFFSIFMLAYAFYNKTGFWAVLLRHNNPSLVQLCRIQIVEL